MWRDQLTGGVVERHDQIRAMRPGVVLPDVLTEADITSLGFDVVVMPAPVFDANTHVAEKGGVVLVEGVWTLQWNITKIQRYITRLAFRNRFTMAEKVALEIAALDNPAATMAERQNAAALRAHMKDQENAQFIDLDDPVTRGGVQSLETSGLLGAGRAAVILDTPVSDVER